MVLFGMIGERKDKIKELSDYEKQLKLTEFIQRIRHVYIPMKMEYLKHRGLSERQLKIRLEKNGWDVWRGACINIVRKNDLYPNVKRKYSRLIELLKQHHPEKIEFLQYISSVHHGMPDFFCYRDGKFKFVECKFKHEQLSSLQKKCIQRLNDLGFAVEVHKLVSHPTKTREALVHLESGGKEILAKQIALASF